jgi:hypothetical protein
VLASAWSLGSDRADAQGLPPLVFDPNTPAPAPRDVPPDQLVPPPFVPAPNSMAPPEMSAPAAMPYAELPPEISPHAERWRYLQYNGLWWYYQPAGRWMYWTEGHWVECPATRITRRTVPAARPPEYAMPPQPSRPFRPFRANVGVGSPYGAAYYGPNWGPYPYAPPGPFGYYRGY